MNAHIILPPTTNSFLSSQWNEARTDCSFIKIVSNVWFLSSLNSVALDETWYSFQRSALLSKADYTFATPVEFGCWEIPPSLIPLINANNTLNRISTLDILWKHLQSHFSERVSLHRRDSGRFLMRNRYKCIRKKKRLLTMQTCVVCIAGCILTHWKRLIIIQVPLRTASHLAGNGIDGAGTVDYTEAQIFSGCSNLLLGNWFTHIRGLAVTRVVLQEY